MDAWLGREWRAGHPEFAALVEGADDEVNLAEAALLVARDAYSELAVADYLGRLDEMAAEAGGGLAPEVDLDTRLAALVAWYTAAGFRGNVTDYYDPRNSYLNEVMDRRLGIPITLALVLMEVGRRLGVLLTPVGLPGHVVLGWAGPGELFWLDPFRPATRMTEADCRRRVEEAYGRSLTWNPQWLAPLTPRPFLLRLLNNLRGVYLGRGEAERVIPVLEKMLLLAPDELSLMRELGVIHLDAGRISLGVRYLEYFLEHTPPSLDHPPLLRRVQQAARRVAQWN
ncbi:MAG: transglutaminase family protein [Anaerolineae bacterium]|nr:transglutaminase family protein [Anaerolineae bacterium]